MNDALGQDNKRIENGAIVTIMILVEKNARGLYNISMRNMRRNR